MNQASVCRACGVSLNPGQDVCSDCGAIQSGFTYKSRIAAAALAIFGGMFGLHRFFLGQWWGIFYLLFFWTYIPWLVGLIEGIVFLATSQEDWNRKYNKGVFVGSEKGTVVIVFAVLIPLIAIIGILAAVAIPAYHDYTVRAKVSQVIQMTDETKAAVAEYTVTNQAWPRDNVAVGISKEMDSPYVEELEISDGVISIDLSDEVPTEGELIFVPSYSEGNVLWDCTESTVEDRLLPSECK